MAYLETNASPAIARFVQAFWQSKGEGSAGAAQRVLPDACADVIVDLSDPTVATGACANFIGTMTRAIVVPDRGASELFGIRFRPGVAALLWPLPMAELCNGRAAFADAVDTRSNELTHRLAAAEEFSARVANAEEWLLREIALRSPDIRKLDLVVALNASLERGDGPDAIASAMDWHPRKTQRFFNEIYGASAVTLSCFWRYERARHRLQLNGRRSLAEFALDCGYADQAHLAREFQRFSGLTIGEWRGAYARSA